MIQDKKELNSLITLQIYGVRMLKILRYGKDTGTVKRSHTLIRKVREILEDYMKSILWIIHFLDVQMIQHLNIY